MRDLNQTTSGRSLPIQSINQKHGFICYLCGRPRPWIDIEFSKDGSGRYRRVCRMCEMSYRSMEDLSDGTLN